jgi:hypothetical protein
MARASTYRVCALKRVHAPLNPMCGPSCPTDGARGPFISAMCALVGYGSCTRVVPQKYLCAYGARVDVSSVRTQARARAAEPRCAGRVAPPMGHVALFISAMCALVGYGSCTRVVPQKYLCAYGARVDVSSVRTQARARAAEPRCAGPVAPPMGHVALFISAMCALVGVR